MWMDTPPTLRSCLKLCRGCMLILDVNQVSLMTIVTCDADGWCIEVGKSVDFK